MRALRRGGDGADIESVRRLVQQDPKRVANALKSWVSDDAYKKIKKALEEAS